MGVIDIKQIEHLADLAKISLTAGEKKHFAGELSSILEYAGKLAEISDKTESIDLNADDGPAAVNAHDGQLREDRVVGVAADELEELIGLVPEKQDRLIKSKPVF